MKKTEMYQCEVCETFFESEELAIACENKGIEKDVTNEGELIRIKTHYGIRTGRIVSIEMKGHEKNYTIGIYPASYGMHFNYESTIVLNGNEEATKRIILFDKD